MISPTQLKVISYVLIVVGIVIIYILRRRRFNRRAITGLEQFRSYESSWITRFVETLFSLLGWLFILAGVSMLFFLYKHVHV